MCSKNVEAVARPVRAPGPSRAWSITRRLTLLYVASTVALLVLSAEFLYWTLKRNLETTRHGMLASKIQVLRLLLREHPDKAEALDSEVEHEASASQPFRYYIRILDLQGQTLLETPGMKDLLPVASFPAPLEATDEALNQIAQELRHQGEFLLLSARVVVGAAGSRSRVLQVGLDASAGNALLADYRRKLVAMLGLGTLLAALVGDWVARNGMRPLARITTAAQHITASQLRDRIAPAQWPAELVELAMGASHPQKVRLVGTPEYQYALEASSDLMSWTPLTTNTAMALLNYTPRWGFEFTDTNSAATAKRFFRARQVNPAP